MALQSGSLLGSYEILSPLGAGGMGEVYRARDRKLDRDVAIKVLPESVAAEPDRLARFEREAKAVAALSHPNILAIHDFGSQGGIAYLVTELLEGETLRTSLAAGPIPQKQAVDYALQVARGLSAAHEKGIVHRDLKPENLFVTKDGRVKILDFGLAKLTQPALPSLSLTEAPTVVPSTDVGIVLGTVGYMSPEQVLGKPLDARSDLFSLGVVLYEMLSGKRPFQRDNPPETMAAILREEPPDLSETGRSVPPGLDRIVRHCLEKDPANRFQSARDVAFGLEALTDISRTSAAAVAPRPGRSGRRLPALLTGAFVSVIALGLGFLLGRRTAQPEPPSFYRITWRHGYVESARFAPDGQTVLYSASWDGKPPAIYLKRPEGPDAVPLDLPSAKLLAISPSGEMAIQLKGQGVHMFVARGTLARVALTGGTPREIAENVNQVDWGPDGSLVVARDVNGKGRLEYPIGKSLYETAGHVSFPRLSPRADLIAFIDNPLPGDDRGSIAVIDLRGAKRTLSKEFESVRGLAWSPSGELWFTAAAAGIGHALWGVTPSGRQRAIANVPGDVLLEDVTPSGRVLLKREENRGGIRWLPPGETRERDLSWFGFSPISRRTGRRSCSMKGESPRGQTTPSACGGQTVHPYGSGRETPGPSPQTENG